MFRRKRRCRRLTAMRHFAGLLARQPFPLLYARLDDPDAAVDDLAAIVACQVERHQPGAVVVTDPARMACWRRCRSRRSLGLPTYGTILGVSGATGDVARGEPADL